MATKKASKKPRGIMDAIINCSSLYIRSAPIPSASIVGVLMPNDSFVVDLESSENDWYYICTNKCVFGYCKKKFITLKQ